MTWDGARKQPCSTQAVRPRSTAASKPAPPLTKPPAPASRTLPLTASRVWSQKAPISRSRSEMACLSAVRKPGVRAVLAPDQGSP